MTALSDPSEAPQRPWWQRSLMLSALIPILLLGVLLAVIVTTQTGLGDRTAPPIEELTINRITLPIANQLVVSVTNGGPDPITVAQVQVDDAYWMFEITPDKTIPRLGNATITLPYPWVQDEPHLVTIITTNGVTFAHELAVATRTPGMTIETIGRYALLGIYVGFIPVSLGLLWFPVLRRLGRGGMQVILSLTIGLLVFLLVDTLAEAMEVIADTAPIFGGSSLVLMVTLISCGFLMTLGRNRMQAPPSRLQLAYRIAIGIGLHNLGEGLAIGAAFASGSAALGTFLVIGFTLHNITEGIGIAAPLTRERPSMAHFVGLAALAGLPAVLGVWIGGFIYNTVLTALFLALGAGAIAQVIYEVGHLLYRQSNDDKTPLFSKAVFGGFVAGVGIMYVTALLVTA